jgi:hypothetical protein
MSTAIGVRRRQLTLTGYTDQPSERSQLVAHLAAAGPVWQVEKVTTARTSTGASVTQVEVVLGEPSARPGAVQWALAAGIKATQAAELAVHARNEGLQLVSFDAPARVAFGAALPPITVHLRQRLASAMKTDPWNIELLPIFGLEGLERVQVTRCPQLTGDVDKRIAWWLDFARSVVGHSGWYVQLNDAAGTVELLAGVEVNLPPSTPYHWSIIDNAEWGEMVVGTDGLDRPVICDLSVNPHALVVGKTGSGKSIFLETFAYGALVHGFELAIVDPTKRGLDFRWARPFVRPGGWGCQNFDDALATLKAIYAEGMRRLDILDELNLPKWRSLKPEQLEEYGIRPVMVIVDEGTSLAKLVPVPKSLPADDPDRIESEGLNATKERILNIIDKISRELRFVGVHLVFGTQRFSVSDIGPGAGGLRENLGVRILLGRASAIAIGMAFADPTDAAEAYQQAHGVAAAGDPGAGKEKKPGRGLAEIDGQDTVAFQGSYAGHEELAEKLAERGVTNSLNDGRPVPENKKPSNTVTTVTDSITDLGEISFSLDDLDEDDEVAEEQLGVRLAKPVQEEEPEKKASAADWWE